MPLVVYLQYSVQKGSAPLAGVKSTTSDRILIVSSFGPFMLNPHQKSVDDRNETGKFQKQVFVSFHAKILIFFSLVFLRNFCF